jgi:WD domain, G-beta repeat
VLRVCCLCKGGYKSCRLLYYARLAIADRTALRRRLTQQRQSLTPLFFAAAAAANARRRKPGRYLAVVSFDGTTCIWEKVVQGVTVSFDVAATLEGHENEVKSVAWASDGALVATCGRDKSVWIWESVDDGADYECVTVLHGHLQDVKVGAAWP